MSVKKNNLHALKLWYMTTISEMLLFPPSVFVWLRLTPACRDKANNLTLYHSCYWQTARCYWRWRVKTTLASNNGICRSGWLFVARLVARSTSKGSWEYVIICIAHYRVIKRHKGPHTVKEALYLLGTQHSEHAPVYNKWLYCTAVLCLWLCACSRTDWGVSLVIDSVDRCFITQTKYPRSRTSKCFKEFHQSCFQWKLSLRLNGEAQRFIIIKYSLLSALVTIQTWTLLPRNVY